MSHPSCLEASGSVKLGVKNARKPRTKRLSDAPGNPENQGSPNPSHVHERRCRPHFRRFNPGDSRPDRCGPVLRPGFTWPSKVFIDRHRGVPHQEPPEEGQMNFLMLRIAALCHGDGFNLKCSSSCFVVLRSTANFICVFTTQLCRVPQLERHIS